MITNYRGTLVVTIAAVGLTLGSAMATAGPLVGEWSEAARSVRSSPVQSVVLKCKNKPDGSRVCIERLDAEQVQQRERVREISKKWKHIREVNEAWREGVRIGKFRQRRQAREERNRRQEDQYVRDMCGMGAC